MLAAPAYFDHNATTPPAREVLAMMPAAMGEVYGNASSIHRTGQQARQELETARRRVAALLGCDSREIVFTSGGTEADNLALLGAARRTPGCHIITAAIEHAAVLNPCAQLEREGFAVTYVRVGPSGVVDPDDVRAALRPDTVLLSVMHANNEIGTLQPVAEIARIAREAGAIFHCDGVQAVGKLPVNVGELGVDLYSISGHKFYGPKGAGALYVRTGVSLHPLTFGGRHEQGYRPGTENVPGLMGMGKAAETARAALAHEPERLAQLRDRLEKGIAASVPDVMLNGAGAPRLSNTTNICFRGIEGEAMVIALDLRGYAVSTGSACSSGAVEPSHVLTAIGLSRKDAKSSVRISLGRGNNSAQVDDLIDAISSCAAVLRRLSPDYAHA